MRWKLKTEKVDTQPYAGTPPPISLNDLFELRIFCQMGEQGSVNVRQYLVTHVGSGGFQPSDILPSISDSVGGQLKPLLSASATYRGVGFRRVLPSPPSVEYLSNSSSGVGTVTGVAMPKQDCGIITFTTAYAGRGYRGRMYLPFPGVSDNGLEGTPIAGYMARVTPYAIWLSAPLNFGVAPNDITLTPVIWHKLLGYATQISGYRTPQKWATQRRRGDYGRPNFSPV